MLKLYTVLLVFITTAAFSQSDPNFKIAILPVTASATSDNTYKENVRESISKIFTQKARFTVLDRSKMDDIVKDKNMQRQDDYVKQDFLDAGKNTGAQFFISANINTLTFKDVPISKSRSVPDPVTKKTISQAYTVPGTSLELAINIEVIDLYGGNVKSSKVFSQKLQYENTNHQEGINNALQKMETGIRDWVNDAFPVDMKILKIESFNKKGLPEKVLIKGGADADLEKKKGNMTNPFGSSSKLEVYENEEVTADGKTYNRQIKVGELKADEIQGDLTVCKVTDGADAIKKKMDEGKTLSIKVVKY